jgi:hypothetical protein
LALSKKSGHDNRVTPIRVLAEAQARLHGVVLQERVEPWPVRKRGAADYTLANAGKLPRLPKWSAQRALLGRLTVSVQRTLTASSGWDRVEAPRYDGQVDQNA